PANRCSPVELREQPEGWASPGLHNDPGSVLSNSLSAPQPRSAPTVSRPGTQTRAPGSKTAFRRNPSCLPRVIADSAVLSDVSACLFCSTTRLPRFTPTPGLLDFVRGFTQDLRNAFQRGILRASAPGPLEGAPREMHERPL